jgi:hypothetical protein
MCCLRYEQEAYEDLVKKVPRQGAFVETKDGYGTAVQVNLLRQTVKVKLDEDSDDSLRLYKANELCAVPGGRPKDGEAPAHVLNYVPEPEEEPEEVVDDWVIPSVEPEPTPAEPVAEVSEPRENRENRNNRNRNNRRRSNQRKPRPQNATQTTPEERQVATAQTPSVSKGTSKNNRNKRKNNSKVVKVEAKPVQNSNAAKAPQPPREGAPRRNNNRRRYNNKPKASGENKQS